MTAAGPVRVCTITAGPPRLYVALPAGGLLCVSMRSVAPLQSLRGGRGHGAAAAQHGTDGAVLP